MKLLEQLCITDGITVKLHCCVTGIEDPVTTWYKIADDGTHIPINTSDPDITINTDDPLNPILCISPFSSRHAGKYRYNTTNNAGDDSGDVDIKCKL